MKWIIALLALCFPASAFATCSGVPNVFIPNTVIVSGAVNSNFTAMINCINAIDGGQITSGTIPVVHGGTGATSQTNNGVAFYSSGSTTITTSSAILWNPLANDGSAGAVNGNAIFLLTPPLGTDANSNKHTVGQFMTPSLSGTTVTTDDLAMWNMKWGTGAGFNSPMAAGTKGNLVGYECNINSAQTNTDSTNDGHCFGGTITLSGGAGFNPISLALIQSTTAGNIHGVNVNITQNIANSGTATDLFLAGSGGSQNATTGYAIDSSNNKFVAGFDAAGTEIANATILTFANSSDVATGCEVVGNIGDTFRISGCGTNGGMILAGQPTASGSKGSIKFMNDLVTQTVLFAFDLANDNMWIGSDVSGTHGFEITAAGSITRLDTGGNITISPGSGGFVSLGTTTMAGAFTLAVAATSASAGQISIGSTTSSASSCGSLAGAAGCMVINVAGTTRNVPFF